MHEECGVKALYTSDEVERGMCPALASDPSR